MTSPDRKSESGLKIGEMPTPRYMREAGDTVGGGIIKWVGMEAYSADGEVKKFLWWRNRRAGNLNDQDVRHDAAAFVARLKIKTGADAAIGLPVDLYESNPKTGFVKTVDEPDLVGVYIEADERPMFNSMTSMQVVKTEGQLGHSKEVEFDEVFQKAKAVLPYPEPSSTSK